MTKEEIQARFNQLPEVVRDYLYEESIGELNGIIIDDNDLAENQRPILFGLIKELLVGAVPLEGALAEVQKRFALDEAKSRRLALDILGYRLLPLDGFVGDVSGQIRALGADPMNFPTDRVEVAPKAAAPVVTVAMTLDAHLKSRYQTIADSYAHGVRTEAQILELLERPLKSGGLELSEEVAKKAAAEIVAQGQKTVPVPPAPGTEAPGTVVVESATVPPKPVIDAPTEEDEADVRHFREGVLETPVADQSKNTDDKVKASVEEIYAAAGIVPADEALQIRLKSAIEARLRDIRDSLETLELLVQPKELGGVALKEEDARKILRLIDDKLRAVHEAHRQEVDAAKQAWAAAEIQRKTLAEAAVQAHDKKEVDTLYQAIIAKSAKAQKNAPIQTATSVAAGTGPAAGSTPAVLVATAPALGAPPPASPVPAGTAVRPLTPPAAPANLPIIPSVPSVPAAPPARVVEKPAPVKVMPAATASPVVPPPRLATAPSARPPMHDIQAAPAVHLTGPVAELRDTALIDFRRLSKVPAEACLKIKDKIDLLAGESYEKRTEGVRAWNDSEVYRTYLTQMKEALEGKPLPEVIAARRAAGQPFLTVEEVKAIAELSQKLRY